MVSGSSDKISGEETSMIGDRDSGSARVVCKFNNSQLGVNWSGTLQVTGEACGITEKSGKMMSLDNA
jgi:hypothetical protein